MVTVGLASQYGHLSDYKAAITICFWTDISPTANWPRLQWVLITPCTTALVGRILDHSWTLLDHMSTFGHLSLVQSPIHVILIFTEEWMTGFPPLDNQWCWEECHFSPNNQLTENTPPPECFHNSSRDKEGRKPNIGNKYSKYSLLTKFIRILLIGHFVETWLASMVFLVHRGLGVQVIVISTQFQ